MNNDLLSKHNNPGSSFYYSTLHLSKADKHVQNIIFSLFQEWLELHDNSHEAQITHTALHWWLEQFQAFEKSEVSVSRGRQQTSATTSDQSDALTHPLLLTLLESLNSNQELLHSISQGLQKIIIAMLNDQHEYNDTEDLDRYLLETWGNLCIVSGLLLGCNSHDEVEIQQQTGLLIAYYQMLKFLPQQLHKDRCPIPESWMNEFELTEGQLIETLRSTDIYSSSQTKKQTIINKITQILDEHHNTLYLQIETTKKLNPENSPRITPPSKIALALQQQWFKLTIKKRFQIFQYRLQLSPFRKRWISWRTK